MASSGADRETRRERILRPPAVKPPAKVTQRRRLLVRPNEDPQPRKIPRQEKLVRPDVAGRLRTLRPTPSPLALEQVEKSGLPARDHVVARDSDESSSSENVAKKSRREKNLARRRHRRLHLYVQESMEAIKLGLSLLEKKAITANTERYYQAELSGLKAFAKRQGVDLNKKDTRDTEVDRVITEYFNHLFMAGHPAHRGDKILASLMHFRSQYSRMGGGKLPRSWRALKGWKRLSPGQSRRAMPLAVWCAISMELVRMGQLRMALFLM
ncbi:pksN, partial [Symbiodinium sp. CCMP2456]